jgi:hypothetical protein
MHRYLLFVFSFIFSGSILIAASEKVLILPFYSDNAEEIAQLNEKMSSASPFQNAELAPSDKIPDRPSDGITSEKFIKDVSALTKKTGASYCLTGEKILDGDLPVIHAALFSLKDKKIVFETKIYLYPNEKDYDPVFDLFGKINLFFENKSFPITKIDATKGVSSANITISWVADPECSQFIILRSQKADGPFLPIATSATQTFKDTKCDIGVRYFYKILPHYNGIRLEPSDVVDGYKKPSIPKGEDLKTMLATFNKPRPKMSGDEAKKTEATIAKIRQYYQNRVKLNMTLYIIRDYVAKKEIIVYRRFKNYTIDEEKREIVLHPDNNSYLVIFSNNTFFKRIVSIGDPELTERLLKNGVFFCVPTGYREVTTDSGDIKYIPVFEAIGMCTQYFTDCNEWSNSTLIFGTSNKDLKGQMEDAKKKLEGEPADQ